MIKVSNLTKIYNEESKNSLVVLDNCAFYASTGEKIFLTGESGAGKTTFLKIIGLMDKKFLGDYLINDLLVNNLSANQLAILRNEMIGFVFQDYRLLDEETVFDNIMIPLLYSKKFKRRERQKQITSIADGLCISHYLKKRVRELSGGERQRVAIARAIVNDPNIIIMDEPINSLNNSLKLQIMDYIDYLAGEDKLMIIATHDDEIIKHYAWKKYLLENHCLSKVFER